MDNGRIFLGAIIIAGAIYVSAENKNTDFFIDDVNIITQETETAFKDAEKEILGSTPPPKPENPVGPNPDPNKCICKGTGRIVQGDGHVSPCPYHSKEISSQSKPQTQDQSTCETIPNKGTVCETTVQYNKKNGINYNRSSAWSRGIFVNIFKK
jgi:hypothetical protein